MQNLFKKAVILLVLCLLATTAEAQLRPVTSTLQNAVAATGDGSVLNVDGYSTVGVQVTISNTATVTFEATQNLSTWQAVVCILTSNATQVTTATATGTYQCAVAGMVQFRARISAYTSGTVTVTATASPAVLWR